MAFDAGMLACIVSEIKKTAVGARVEKVNQPARDEVVLLLHTKEGERKLLINAGGNSPRLGFTAVKRENPLQAPMFCMLLRKHLSGSRLVSAEQAGFERVAYLKFGGRDEMGFECEKVLVCEMMGKYSNLILCDGDMKVIVPLKTIDFSTSLLRQVLPGKRYELPPLQEGKITPIGVTRETFFALAKDYNGTADRFIIDRFSGLSSQVAREIVFRATRTTERIALSDIDLNVLWAEFSRVMEMIESESFEPSLVSVDQKISEYAFLPLTYLGGNGNTEKYESAGYMLDAFFSKKDRENSIRQKASDIIRILINAESRITRKLEAQRGELADCEKSAEYRKFADLITSNIHLINKGDKKVKLIDYEVYDGETGEYGSIELELDSRLTPSANAQKYYKRYTKSKHAKEELTRQIEIGEHELEYLSSVFDSLTRAEGTADLAEIREELYRSGYSSRMKSYTSGKQKTPQYSVYYSRNGYKILCGKNNTQNEYVTHKLAEKTDWWFHAKGVPGSHVVLVWKESEPTDGDLTDACEIAAFNSKAYAGDKQKIAVDYLPAGKVKKVTGEKPGFVIYHTNKTAYVEVDENHIAEMKKPR